MKSLESSSANRMQKLVDKYPMVLLVRGKGLLNAIVVDDDEEGHLAWDICVAMASKGLLAKPTHGNIITLCSSAGDHRRSVA